MLVIRWQKWLGGRMDIQPIKTVPGQVVVVVGGGGGGRRQKCQWCRYRHLCIAL